MNIVTQYHEVMRQKRRAKPRSQRYAHLHVRSVELLKKILQKQNRKDRRA